jgi:predicted lipoprotein with Yx(FWY)xxD motif
MVANTAPRPPALPVRAHGIAHLLSLVSAATLLLALYSAPSASAAAPSEAQLRLAILSPADLPPGFSSWELMAGFEHPRFPDVPPSMPHYRVAYDRTTRDPRSVELLSVMLVDATDELAAFAALQEFAESRVAVRGLVAVVAAPAEGQPALPPVRARRTAQPPPDIGVRASRYTVQSGSMSADVVMWRHADVFAVVVSEKISQPANEDLATALGYAWMQQEKLAGAFPPSQSPASPAPPAAAPPPPQSSVPAVAPPGAPQPARTVALQARPVDALGTILVDGRGFTLYTFAGDSPDTSACLDGCAATWPPMEVDWGDQIRYDGLSAAVLVIARADGRRQVTYNGRPLYFYTGDHQPGDTHGHGLGGVWSVLAITPPSSP